MELKQCDRCGLIGIEDFKEISYVAGFGEYRHYKDLCGDCVKRLHKWIKNK